MSIRVRLGVRHKISDRGVPSYHHPRPQGLGNAGKGRPRFGSPTPVALSVPYLGVSPDAHGLHPPPPHLSLVLNRDARVLPWASGGVRWGGRRTRDRSPPRAPLPPAAVSGRGASIHRGARLGKESGADTQGPRGLGPLARARFRPRAVEGASPGRSRPLGPPGHAHVRARARSAPARGSLRRPRTAPALCAVAGPGAHRQALAAAPGQGQGPPRRGGRQRRAQSSAGEPTEAPVDH